MGVVCLIVTGLFLFVFHDASIDYHGAFFAFMGSFFSGLRWTFAQKYMQKDKLGVENPIDFVYHIQPLMILTLVPFFALEKECKYL